MKKLSIALLFAVFCSGAVFAAGLPAAIDEAAQRMTELSVKEVVSANDPRLAQTRTLLEKAIKRSQESPVAVEAACLRYVGHLHDSAHIQATPLELLEALVRFGKAGKPMQDTLQDYVAARKAAAAKSHAEAMTALGAKK